MHDDAVDRETDGMTETVEFPEAYDFPVDAERDIFLTNLALFYLRMQAKMLLPASTISVLIEEFQEVCTNTVSQLFVRLREELAKLDIPDERICSIIDGLSKENLLKIYNEGMFRSDSTRKTFFKKHFSYVEPIQVHLGYDASGTERFCQYVPVKETLKALFQLSSVREQYYMSKMHSAEDTDVLEDVRDGKTYKENSLLQEFPSSVSIILYQDAFEVVNPLGSGKKKHKLLAVYMTLSDILPHNRSSIDPMQLVMLCRESDYQFFGQEKVFFSLVEDLKELEQSGITLEMGQTVKAVVTAIVGDNLGSHSLGGFIENFSKSKNFCRYCLINRDSFVSEPTVLGPARTAENYKSCVESLSLGLENSVDGIKFDSIFNSLSISMSANQDFHHALGMISLKG
ncbi:RecBCD enzyme subunit RecC [Labeo rohita]|uniref:RecBCD enzyme subunit RecC n=1 Tax=Labeo rohita TaxID=84645 RepID=A0ABQ8L3H7_LABRO|nr:RecBCD enzyme subunit RecC [Labeo rohita]